MNDNSDILIWCCVQHQYHGTFNISKICRDILNRGLCESSNTTFLSTPKVWYLTRRQRSHSARICCTLSITCVSRGSPNHTTWGLNRPPHWVQLEKGEGGREGGKNRREKMGWNKCSKCLPGEFRNWDSCILCIWIRSPVNMYNILTVPEQMLECTLCYC